jgi:uncharacterized protein YkwD
MGIADREYMRRPSRVRPGQGSILGAGAVLFLLAIIVFPGPRQWVRGHLGSNKPLVVTYRPLGVGQGITLGRPYPLNDQWGGFLPAPSSCPGSTSAPTTELAADRSMICVLNHARVREGLAALPVSQLLNRSSRLKALDIIRCQQFSHQACGRDAHAVADAVGYPQVTWGENIAAGSGPFMPARVAADGWLNSPHHRENLFRPQWTEQGIAVVVADRFKGQRKVAIWVSEFGERR